MHGSSSRLSKPAAIMLPLFGRGAKPRVEIVADSPADQLLVTRGDKLGGVANPAIDAFLPAAIRSTAIEEIVEGGAPAGELSAVHRRAMTRDQSLERRGGKDRK